MATRTGRNKNANSGVDGSQETQILHDHKEVDFETSELGRILLEFNFVISYQSGKKNDKANALTQKPKNCFTDKENEQLEHCMYMLLPLECFEWSVELQPIEENENPLSAKTPDCKTASAVKQSELHAFDKLKDLTLP